MTTFEKGIYLNLLKMRELYPGFVMRVYTNIDLDSHPTLCLLHCINPDLHWCDIRMTPLYGDLSGLFPMTWRFLGLGDPTVDLLFSRDLDSVLTLREAAVVNDWLKETDKSFHLMRDNPYHNYPILGGLWGVSNTRLEEAIGIETVEAVVSEMVEISKNGTRFKKGFDQNVLYESLFEFGDLSPEMMVYDSYSCEKVWFDIVVTLVRPFPVKRLDSESDFVGNVELGQAKYNLSECPVECRPSYGKDWTFC